MTIKCKVVVSKPYYPVAQWYTYLCKDCWKYVQNAYWMWRFTTYTRISEGHNSPCEKCERGI